MVCHSFGSDDISNLATFTRLNKQNEFILWVANTHTAHIEKRGRASGVSGFGRNVAGNVLKKV